ncbi:Na+/H+ antiporter subunit A [Micrococcus sp. M4NT]|uniref:Na+/H+ antiporter subunit A n=1 Tax=Micrococcus sp. M4NT TaxID=2957501 RepID=UPI0029B2A2D5|nr:Na+/H+ antiporter subunit A [Micrococcus sp. M4NT]MDX2340687.1 Na+/H+ antiporter subunit A [Micrococcus sp. M4NT]
MLLTLIVLFAVALCAPAIFRWTGRQGFYLLAAVPAAGFLWVLAQLPHVLALQEALDAGAPAPAEAAHLERTVPWVPYLDIDLAFRLDALAAFMSLIVLGVGALVLAYCARYFAPDERRSGVFGGQLLAFAGAMFGLVTTDDLMVLYTFWEITSVLSFLLIGYSGHRIFARRSAIQALIVTTFGGLAMLVGLVMLAHLSGSWRVSGVLAAAPALVADAAVRGMLEAAVALVLLGALTKSAQAPFHFWLPAAMAAPTPVSAYLHAAAMVKAGVFLVARLAPAFATLVSWQTLVLGVGLATLLLGGWRAMRQDDIKLILAYGTVSQLGFLMVANGLGTRDAAMAGLAMLLAHAIFKAPLFMVVGVIDHEAGTRDLRELSGIGRRHPVLAGVAVLAAASMAGLPPLFGFVAKESVLETLAAHGEHGAGAWAWAPFVLMAVGSVLTFAYTWRFVWGAFGRRDPRDAKEPGVGGPRPVTEFHSPVTALQLGPAAVLAVACLVLGLVPGSVAPLVEAATHGLAPASPGEKPAHLALWHGFTPILAVSAGIWALGALLAWTRRPVQALQARLQSPVDAARTYGRLIGVLDEVAVWVTGRTQTGSLRRYLAIMFACASVLPLGFLLLPVGDSDRVLATSFLDARIVLAESPAQLGVAVLLCVAAVATVRAHRRFMAVMLVSVTGYGAAALFAMRGAPDLAITQVLVESVVLVTLIFGLRVLPPEWLARREGNRRLTRLLLALSFSAVMVWVAATSLAARTAERISVPMPDLAYEFGYGTNAVNVTLVDIRAWDTWGEITVLAAAATGVASLVFLQHRDGPGKDIADVRSGSVGDFGADSALGARELTVVRAFAVDDTNNQWLVAGRTMAPERRSIILEVVTRFMFPIMMLMSLYLLLAGHNTPGGGFAGALLAGLALTLRYLAGGRFELQEASLIPAGAMLGLGLGLATLVGIAPVFFGGQILQSYALELHGLPLFGDHLKFVSATAFDVGVYLVVVGLVMDVLRSLGGEVDRRGEAARRARRRAAERRRHPRLPTPSTPTGQEAAR